MKVKELIEKLKEYDGEMQVVVYDREDHTYDDCIELNKEIQSFMLWADWKPLGSRIDRTLEEAEENTKKWKLPLKRDILVIYADY